MHLMVFGLVLTTIDEDNFMPTKINEYNFTQNSINTHNTLTSIIYAISTDQKVTIQQTRYSI